ncbi:MAG: ROK family protein [Candidatus Solibacter sp.]|jgi:predicted NBD/HSP70 family sugar kinase
MGRSIGVLATGHLWAGIVDGAALGTVKMYPEPGQPNIDLRSVPAPEIVAIVRGQVRELAKEGAIESVGAGFPGVIRGGVILESPNLGQLKGLHLAAELRAALKADGIDVPVVAINNADALAAGIAATHESMDQLVRVWHLGDGIGYGRHPHNDGVWEAGHMVVTLDPKERYCGCGGIGHLEGIMGHRAMRLRFLDMEPEEVFVAARHGDQRAGEFLKLWHRALAAGTANSIHLDGPGRFYLAGPNADFVDLRLLGGYLQEMVKMSPLQGSYFQIVPTSHDMAVIGAAVASRAR